MILIMLYSNYTYITHNYYIFIITQRGHSPLDRARNPLFHVPEDRKRKVFELLEREEKKLRK